MATLAGDQGTSSDWSVPRACAPWPPPPRLVDVDSATLTPHERLQQSVDGRRTVRLRGAVHDSEGWLVPQSQRIAGRNDRNVPSDPPRINVPGTEAELLGGSWYYLGHWMWQFGHFMFETLPTLWAHRGEPLVAHRFGSTDPPAPWQRRLMELAGVPSVPHVVADRPVRVERLRVATRPSVVGASAAPAAVEIWQRISMAAGAAADRPAGEGRMVALSRSRLEESRPPRGPKLGRVIRNARALDELWERNGFEVVHPETLSIDAQMRLLREARVLIGVDGSALHASAFTRPGTPVIVVGNRDRPRGNLTQAAIDSAMGNPQVILPWQGVSETSQEIDLDVHERRLRAVLRTVPGAPARV